jgi:hypothetical protein
MRHGGGRRLGKFRGPSYDNEMRLTHKDRWEQGFAALRKFRRRKGHCCPSRRHMEGNFKLGSWVAVQRYHKDLVPPERKRHLDAIGFVWDWREDHWEQYFAALLEFKRRERHCCVPISYNEGNLRLGWWVSTQRKNRKIMSAERRARLNKINFVWNAGAPGVRQTTKTRNRK